MGFGDKYMTVIGSCLKSGNIKAKNFLLGGNRISSHGARHVIKGIAKQAAHLDLKGNRIGEEGIIEINVGLKQRDCRIQYLNLEDNNLGSKAASKLLQRIAKNNTLKVLNLSKNLLDDMITE